MTGSWTCTPQSQPHADERSVVAMRYVLVLTSAKSARSPGSPHRVSDPASRVPSTGSGRSSAMTEPMDPMDVYGFRVGQELHTLSDACGPPWAPQSVTDARRGPTGPVALTHAVLGGHLGQRPTLDAARPAVALTDAVRRCPGRRTLLRSCDAHLARCSWTGACSSSGAVTASVRLFRRGCDHGRAVGSCAQGRSASRRRRPSVRRARSRAAARWSGPGGRRAR